MHVVSHYKKRKRATESQEMDAGFLGSTMRTSILIILLTVYLEPCISSICVEFSPCNDKRFVCLETSFECIDNKSINARLMDFSHAFVKKIPKFHEHTFQGVQPKPRENMLDSCITFETNFVSFLQRNQ